MFIMNQEKLNNKCNSFKNDFTQEDAGKVMENMEKLNKLCKIKLCANF